MMKQVEFSIRQRQARDVLVGAPIAGIVWLLLIRLIAGEWSFGFPLAIVGFSIVLSFLMVCPAPLGTYAYRFWKGLIWLIDWVVSRVVCFVLFYLIFTPMGIILRLCRVRLLSMKDDGELSSRWQKVSPVDDKKGQYFRQY